MRLPAALRSGNAAGRLAALILVAFAARAVTLGSPLVHVDETFYLTVADAMRHGAIPYVDVWDRKPVGLFLLYWPAAILGLPASLYAYQLMAGAAVVATAWLIARLAERAGWRAGALPAAIFYIFWLDLADGQGGQTPVFYNLLTAGAALLVLKAEARGDRPPGLVAMLLIGVAMQIKYTVAFEGIGFALWLLWADWGRRRSVAGTLSYAAALVLVALSPTLGAAAVYGLVGQLDAFIFSNFVSILHRKSDSPALTHLFLRDALAILTPLCLVLTGRRGQARHAERHVALLLRAWLAIALAAFVGFGGWYNHYALPVMLPGAVCAAAFFERRARSMLWAAVPLALLFVAGQVILRSERARRGTAAQFATLADVVGRGPGGLFVYSGPVLLYPATGRPALTRYLFPSHLEFRREAGSIGVNQAAEIGRVFVQAPGAVVMGPPIREEDPAIRALVLRDLARGGYIARPPVTLGHDAMIVYRRATSRP